MLNVILLCLLLGVIGAAYVWLGDRTKTRAEWILETNRKIKDLELQIKWVDGQLKTCLTDGELRVLADRDARDLKDISQAPKGTVITLPPAGSSTAAAVAAPNPIARADNL